MNCKIDTNHRKQVSMLYTFLRHLHRSFLCTMLKICNHFKFLWTFEWNHILPFKKLFFCSFSGTWGERVRNKKESLLKNGHNIENNFEILTKFFNPHTKITALSTITFDGWNKETKLTLNWGISVCRNISYVSGSFCPLGYMTRSKIIPC